MLLRAVEFTRIKTVVTVGDMGAICFLTVLVLILY